MTYEECTQDEGQQVGMAGDQRSRDREMKKKVKEGTKEREKDGGQEINPEKKKDVTRS